MFGRANRKSVRRSQNRYGRRQQGRTLVRRRAVHVLAVLLLHLRQHTGPLEPPGRGRRR